MQTKRPSLIVLHHDTLVVFRQMLYELGLTLDVATNQRQCFENARLLMLQLTYHVY
jgi:hypothetical protein